MSIQDLEIEIKHCKLQLKLIKHYLDNPTEIDELHYRSSYEDMLELKQEYDTRLKHARKLMRMEMKREVDY